MNKFNMTSIQIYHNYLLNFLQWFLFARHGKTKNLALWPMDILSASNSNLNEYTAPHRYDEYSFQMPVDGIAGENGLKNQCIVINGVKDADDFIYTDQ